MFFNRKVIASIYSTLFVVSNGFAEIAPLIEEKTRELEECSCEFSDLHGTEISCFINHPWTFDKVYAFNNFGENGSSVQVKNKATNALVDTYDLISINNGRYTYLESGGSGLQMDFMLDPTDSLAQWFGDYEDGECKQSDGPIKFGCWRCPSCYVCPTPPTVFPSNSPSYQESDTPTDLPSSSSQPSPGNNEGVNPTDVVPTDDAGNNNGDNPDDAGNSNGDNPGPDDAGNNNGNTDSAEDDDNNDLTGECCCCEKTRDLSSLIFSLL